MQYVAKDITKVLALLLSRRLILYSAASLSAACLVLIVASIVSAVQGVDLITWEAEGGILSGGIVAVESVPATGQAAGFIQTSASDSGSVAYLIYVPKPGVYRLEASARSETSEEGSFTTSWNDEPESRWQITPGGPDWEWSLGQEASLLSRLNKLVLTHREGEVQIDQLRLRLISEIDPLEGSWAEAGPILYVDAEAGNDLNSGSTDAPLKTLNRALELVQPGQHIRLRTGIYQESVQTQRAGLPDAPIVIEPDIGHSPVLDGRSHELGGMQIEHSYYTVRGLEFRDFYEGFKVYHSTGVIVEHNHIHDISAECVLIKGSSDRNIIRNNVIHDCGLDTNGEGIYIGTPTEKRDLRSDGMADINLRNIVTGNVIYRVTEGVDIKEDSSLNVVSMNYIYDTTEEGTGGINVRGDENFIYDNLVENNLGSGIRLGGDVAVHPEHGEGYQYGRRNVLRGNISRNNGEYGYKLMADQQDIDDTNIGYGNEEGLFRNPQFIAK